MRFHKLATLLVTSFLNGLTLLLEEAEEVMLEKLFDLLSSKPVALETRKLRLSEVFCLKTREEVEEDDEVVGPLLLSVEVGVDLPDQAQDDFQLDEVCPLDEEDFDVLIRSPTLSDSVFFGCVVTDEVFIFSRPLAAVCSLLVIFLVLSGSLGDGPACAGTGILVLDDGDGRWVCKGGSSLVNVL